MMILGKEAPELKEISDWIRGPARTIRSCKGMPVVLYFWDHTCLGCIRGLPFIEALRTAYASAGLVVIGIHAPEYAFARFLDNAAAAVERLGVTMPTAQDDRMASWLLYGNRFMPKIVFIEKGGTAISEHIGFGNEYDVERAARTLLGLDDNDVPRPLWTRASKKLPAWDDVSPTTSLGFKEVLSFSSRASDDQTYGILYRDAGTHEDDKAYLDGAWKQYDQYVEHEDGNEGYVLIPFRAQHAYSVMSVYETPVVAEVLLDGRPVPPELAGEDIVRGERGKSLVRVDGGRLYHLVALPAYGRGELTIRCSEKNLQIYNFQFE